MIPQNIFRKSTARLSLLGLAITVAGLANVTAASKAPEIEVKKLSGVILTDGISKLDFGMVTVGATAKRTLIIRNVGTAPLTGLALTKTGVSKNDYNISPLPVTTLAPGAKMTVVLILSPSLMGPRAAAIHISSNDADENPFDIKLTGMGMGRS